jgi:uncharacterized membrane protein HdeD (DUF308 family)
MLEKIIFWLTENRKKIVYTLGGLNILGGLSLLANGNTTTGAIELFVGIFLVFDSWRIT